MLTDLGAWYQERSDGRLGVCARQGDESKGRPPAHVETDRGAADGARREIERAHPGARETRVTTNCFPLSAAHSRCARGADVRGFICCFLRVPRAVELLDRLAAVAGALRNTSPYGQHETGGTIARS